MGRPIRGRKKGAEKGKGGRGGKRTEGKWALPFLKS